MDSYRAGIFAFTDETLRLSSAPSMMVGLNDALPLHRVSGAVFFREGIAIANSGSNEVLILDSEGRVEARQGREGDGPGEYRNLMGLARDGDGLISWDGYHMRFAQLDSRGQFIGTTERVPTPPFAWVTLVGAFGNSAMLRLEDLGFPGEGAAGPLEVRQDVEFVVVRLSDMEVTLRTSRPGRERWVQRVEGGMNGGPPVIFGREVVAAVTNGNAWLADTDALVLSRYDESGDSSGVSVETEQPGVPAMPHWEDHVRDSLRASMESRSGVSRTFNLSLLEDLPARATIPRFSTMMGGSDGRLWIREYPHPGKGHVGWIALNENMEPEKHVEVPRMLLVLDWSDDRVLVSGKGESGEEIVAVYEIRR